jgi:alpha-beta hydrolase superfamily lysophospholipase
MKMTNERIRFTGAQGHDLSAILSRPSGEPVKACAIFAHCFTCSKDLKPVVNISQALTRHGIAVFRFDFTGLGESEGEFSDTDFSSNIGDLVAAAEYMADSLSPPSILVGHSLGGAAVLKAAARLDEVQAIATIGAPFDPEHVKHLFAGSLDTIEETGSATVTLAGRSFTVSREFVEDLETHGMEQALHELSRPLLVFHSPLDDTVGIENAARIYRAARHPKSFISLDQADHLLLDSADSTYVGTMLATWAARYLPN